MDERTMVLIMLVIFALAIFLAVRRPSRRSRYISKRVQRLAWARFFENYYRDPANRKKAIRKSDYHLDHHIPFVRGGNNEIDNMRVITKKENLKKGSKMP